MSIEQVIAGCPKCGCVEYSFKRISREEVELECFNCETIWVIPEPFTSEGEKVDRKQLYVVNVYSMSFAFEGIYEAQEFQQFALKLGYPSGKVHITFPKITDLDTARKELQWIVDQEDRNDVGYNMTEEERIHANIE